MLKSRQLLGLILGLSLPSTSFSLTLNGMASYEVLRKEIYIASLYLTETSNNHSVSDDKLTQQLMTFSGLLDAPFGARRQNQHRLH
jgi:hypothetical protein